MAERTVVVEIVAALVESVSDHVLGCAGHGDTS
jgi:hypothetical protein